MTAVSISEARALLLAVQGLVEEPPARPTEDDALECVRRMGVLQIDTIHVIARSPYLVLWSRLGNYESTLLEKLHADGKLFEYWSHEACFIPIEDYAIYHRFMLELRHRWWKNRWAWLEKNPDTVARLMAHIEEIGPVRSSDFERTDGQKGNWWNWKHDKVALECLHTSGELMIARREKFQRVYDLRRRVHPNWSDDLVPTFDGAVDLVVAKAIRCLGIAHSKWIGDYFRLPNAIALKAAERLAEAGEIVQVTLENHSGRTFVHRDSIHVLESIRSGTIVPNRTVLLSPFDPVVWDRNRAKTLFDFDYTIECYVPEPKRKYGYFVLPILHKDKLIGRLDAKAHRKERVFEVKALFLEPGVQPDDELIQSVATTIKQCAIWHKTPEVRVTASNPKSFGRSVQAAARRLGKTKA